MDKDSRVCSPTCDKLSPSVNSLAIGYARSTQMSQDVRINGDRINGYFTYLYMGDSLGL